MPRSENLVAVASYFKVPTDHLIHGDVDVLRAELVTSIRKGIPRLSVSELSVIASMIEVLNNKTR